MKRLSADTFDIGYKRSDVVTGVVHLGLGAFHRAHQAPVFDALLREGDTRWGIASIAMRSSTIAHALAEQDGLYSLTECGARSRPRVIGSILMTGIAGENPAKVIALLSAPDVRLVTITITEKGYEPPSGDVETSAGGLLAMALARRREAGSGPLTVMSCDNRSGNGEVARGMVLHAAASLGLDDATIRWIERDVAFPATMVDRITPAPTDAVGRQASAELGLEDRAAIWTESFWQWVVEDRFAGARPDLASQGVQLVANVTPWENAKLRLLNAAHSALAYAGLLAGHRYVHEAIGDPPLRTLVERLWDEAAETLDRTIDIAAYRRALVDRFADPALQHALLQIAADGSQKVPMRLLATMAERAAK